MPVKGGKDVAAALRRMPARVREEVIDAVQRGAEAVLDDMRRFTPLDPATPQHAREGLTIVEDKDGMAAHVGLPTAELASEYFWFRFLDGGTKGYTAGDTRRTGKSKTTKKIYRDIPPRPALHIRQRALDANRDSIEAAVRRAIEAGLKRA